VWWVSKVRFRGGNSHPGRDAWAVFVIANPEGEAIQGFTDFYIASRYTDTNDEIRLLTRPLNQVSSLRDWMGDVFPCYRKLKHTVNKVSSLWDWKVSFYHCE
jgi:hypothetical protein